MLIYCYTYGHAAKFQLSTETHILTICQHTAASIEYVKLNIYKIHIQHHSWDLIIFMSHMSCMSHMSHMSPWYLNHYSPIHTSHVYDLILILRYNNIVVDIILNCWHHTKFCTQYLYIHSTCSQVNIYTYGLSTCAFTSSCVPNIWSYAVHVHSQVHAYPASSCMKHAFSMLTSAHILKNLVKLTLHDACSQSWHHAMCVLKVNIMQHVSQIHGMSTSGHAFSNPWKINIVYSHTLTFWHLTFSHVDISHVDISHVDISHSHMSTFHMSPYHILACSSQHHTSLYFHKLTLEHKLHKLTSEHKVT